MTTGEIALLPDTGICKTGPPLCIVNIFRPSISADGRFVAFAQTAIGNSVSEAVFLGDFTTLTTTNVTTQGLMSFNAFPSVIITPVISADGRSVAFSTHNVILPEDTNSFVDVYRFDHDHDPAGVSGVIQFGQSTYSAKEDGGSVTVPVLRASIGASAPLTVQYTTSDFTATAGSDYVATSGTLSFASGEDVKYITVPVFNDNVSEGVEQFSISLSNPTGGYVIGGTYPLTTVFIHDSIKPTLTIRDATTSEGGDAVFTVTLSQSASQLFAVNFSTAADTATGSAAFDGSGDYRSRSGALFFNPHETTTKTISIHTNRDMLNEPDETFFVRLTPITDDFTIARAQAVGTIHNDTAPVVEFVPAAGVGFSASEADGHAVVTVKRTAGDPSIPFSVNYATADGTASERSDYNAAFGRLDFAPGESVKTFDVLINDDVFVEDLFEDATLSLSSPTNGAILGDRSTVPFIITSDDAAPPASNPLDESQFFVEQHYHDFLGREPDAAGLACWTNEIEQCGSNQQCRDIKRVNVSAAFFLSIEFQQTGFLVYKTYGAAFGTGRVGGKFR